jgi:hypothetical protein
MLRRWHVEALEGQGSAQAGKKIRSSIQRTMLRNDLNGISASRQQVAMDANR